MSHHTGGTSFVLKLANGLTLIFLVRHQTPARWEKGVMLAITPYTGMAAGGHLF
jgi:hypothetical protein